MVKDMSLEEKLAYDEVSIAEKIKNKSEISAVIGLGVLNLVHTLSHIIPAIGALGISQMEAAHHEAIYVFNYDISPIVTNPIMQMAYVAFVPLSFYYLYRDHKHHKHERIIRKQLYETQKLLEETQQKLHNYNKDNISPSKAL
jgi:hypothetical protein